VIFVQRTWLLPRLATEKLTGIFLLRPTPVKEGMAA
jgi:hypothetical protein